MAENAQHNSPAPLKFATPRASRESSPSNLASAAQKQSELLNRYRETNACLLEFKKKTEDGIVSQQEKLREERQKTRDLMKELDASHQRAVNTFQEESQKELQRMSEKPLFDQDAVKSISSGVSKMRAQNCQLRKQFSTAFAEFMKEFGDNKRIVMGMCTESMQKKLTENADEVKARVEDLQQKINKKCSDLARNVKKIHATPHMKLEIGSSLEIEKAVDAASAPMSEQPQIVENRRILCVSNFLAGCIEKYAHIISH